MAKITSPRRREVRKALPHAIPYWQQLLRSYEALWAVLFAVLTMLCAGLIALLAQQRTEYRPDQIAPRAMVARVKFWAVDEAGTSKRKTDAFESEPAVYTPNSTYFNEIKDRLAALVNLGADPSLSSVEQIRLESKPPGFTDETLKELRGFITDGKPTEKWTQLTREFLEGLADVPILDPTRAEIERSPETTKAFRIVIRHPTFGELERSYNTLLSAADSPADLEKRVAAVAARFPPATRRTVVAMVMANPRPTYLYDKEETLRRRQAAMDHEVPVEMKYEPGDVLVKAGKRVTPLDIEVLKREKEVYYDSLGRVKKYLNRAGVLGMMGLLALGLWGYNLAYNRAPLLSPARGFGLVLMQVIGLLAAVLIEMYQPGYIYITATLPILLLAIVLAIIYDQRYGLVGGACQVLLVAVSLNLPMGFTIVQLTGIAVAVAMMHEIRTRSKVVKVGLLSGAAMAMAVFLVGMAQRPIHLPHEWQVILWDSAFVFLAAVIVGMVVQATLPAIEMVFHVCTSMTLKELNDASHPLLRRLAHDAPGTYQHSLRLADMAEAAAEAIGANGLLCRVGAMYHDIGKMNKPLYFVENQGGGPNRHDKLSPAMSLLIIVGHVKDGVEMAREYGLPQQLRHFIESHHGTTLVEYFYHAARRKSDEEESPAPTEFEFRYPGPKPKTREAAITMICDGVEGAARTLPDTTPARLEKLVHKIANARLMDGQFDECNLTLQELKKIEDSITKTLCAVYHGRVKYPTQQEPPRETNTGPQTQAASG